MTSLRAQLWCSKGLPLKGNCQASRAQHSLRLTHPAPDPEISRETARQQSFVEASLLGVEFLLSIGGCNSGASPYHCDALCIMAQLGRQRVRTSQSRALGDQATSQSRWVLNSKPMTMDNLNRGSPNCTSHRILVAAVWKCLSARPSPA